MTNRIEPELLNTVLQLLTTECSSGFAEGLRLLVNEAMVQERSAVLHPLRVSRSRFCIALAVVRRASGFFLLTNFYNSQEGRSLPV
ncbi:MAG: hypothetical protein WCS65_16620 [Verrucomicrobiae bacterium]